MGKNIDFDLRPLERFTDELKQIRTKAVPHAARNALNTLAFEGRKVWIGEMEKAFLLRNKFTTRSIGVQKANLSRDIGSMQSVLGSRAPYMALQEKGGIERGKSGSKPIPTRAAAGQGKGGGKRTRQVRRSSKLSAIRLGPRARFGTRKQRNAIAISRAVRGTKYALIETKRGDAIVRVTGRKRIKLRMVWDLFNRSVPVPRNPTLGRTVKKLEQRLPSIYVDAVEEQIRRTTSFR